MPGREIGSRLLFGRGGPAFAHAGFNKCFVYLPMTAFTGLHANIVCVFVPDIQVGALLFRMAIHQYYDGQQDSKPKKNRRFHAV